MAKVVDNLREMHILGFLGEMSILSRLDLQDKILCQGRVLSVGLLVISLESVPDMR